jgi:ribosomal protein L11 methyltransferase
VTEPRFPLVLVDVDPAEVDEASERLFELGAEGVEERDATTLVKGPAGKVTLVGSFATPAAATAAHADLPRAWAPRQDEIVGDAWRDDWKKYFHPFEVCPGVVVRPPWEEYAGDGRTDAIVLEPGRAFGTGLHETTSLVAETLCAHDMDFDGCSVLDVGCGSGILAIVALRLGAGSARCIDVDPEAVAVTRENASRNGLGDRVKADTCRIDAVGDRYFTVLANIEAGVLAAMAPALARCLMPGGLLILSGILAPDVAPQQLDDVRAAYAALELLEVRRKGEWVALVLRAPKVVQ